MPLTRLAFENRLGSACDLAWGNSAAHPESRRRRSQFRADALAPRTVRGLACVTPNERKSHGKPRFTTRDTTASIICGTRESPRGGLEGFTVGRVGAIIGPASDAMEGLSSR